MRTVLSVAMDDLPIFAKFSHESLAENCASVVHHQAVYGHASLRRALRRNPSRPSLSLFPRYGWAFLATIRDPRVEELDSVVQT